MYVGLAGGATPSVGPGSTPARSQMGGQTPAMSMTGGETPVLRDALSLNANDGFVDENVSLDQS